jgi:hypothetical protein
MSDPLMTASLTKRDLKATRALLAAGAVALGFGLFAVSAQAAPASSTVLNGLTSPGIGAENVGQRRYKRTRVRSNKSQAAATKKANRIPPYNEQSDEIRELRRAFPSTNWPPSDRY